MGAFENSLCLSWGSLPSVYSRRRCSFGFCSSSVPRTRSRAIRYSGELNPAPCSMYLNSLRRGWNIAMAFATSSHAPPYFLRRVERAFTFARNALSRPTFWFQSEAALVVQLGHRQLAGGAAGMPGDEGEIALLGHRRRPLEVMLGPRRLPVLVRADERDIEIVAGKVEVVGIAAEERDGHLRREHQAHVLEPLVPVEAVLPTVIQLDHVAAELVVPGRAVFLD